LLMTPSGERASLTASSLPNWSIKALCKRLRSCAIYEETNPEKQTHMNNKMKIVVIGGSGLIGSKVVNILRQRGHEVLAASPKSGVNTLTGEGLADALTGAQVVVDVANSPSFEDKPALDFFETSGRNLLAAEKTAGVKHHVALS